MTKKLSKEEIEKKSKNIVKIMENFNTELEKLKKKRDKILKDSK